MLDVEVAERNVIVLLRASIDQTLNIHGDARLVLNLSLDVANGFRREGLDVEEMFVSVLDEHDDPRIAVEIGVLVQESQFHCMVTLVDVGVLTFFATSTTTQVQSDGRLLLDVVVIDCGAVFETAMFKLKLLEVRRNTGLVLNLKPESSKFQGKQCKAIGQIL